MNKNEIAYTLSIIVVGISIFFGASALLDSKLLKKRGETIFFQPEITGKEGELLPSFNLLLSDSLTTLNTNNLPQGKASVFLYFSPYCPFCQAEMKEIIANRRILKDIQFYVLTSFPFSEMKNFNDIFKLNEYPNFQAGVDTHFFFVKYFNISRTPFIAIYGKNKRLNGAFFGNISSTQIKYLAEK